MRKLVLGILLLLGGLILLQVSRSGTESEPESAKAGTRIVSLAPNLTGLLFRLGAGDQVVGVTSYCDYPPAAKQRPKIGDFLNPNYEKIVDLEPSLVLAERWSSSKTTTRLRQLGLKVVEVQSPRSIAEIINLIQDIGELLGRKAVARAVTQEMEERIQRIRLNANAFPHRPKLYLEIDVPSWTVGRPSFTHEAIELCGAVNLFGDVERPAPQVSLEAVVERNPEVIVSLIASKEEIASRPGWAGIEAIVSGRIIDDFDEALLSRANHRVVEGMEKLQERLMEVMNFAPSEALEEEK